MIWIVIATVALATTTPAPKEIPKQENIETASSEIRFVKFEQPWIPTQFTNLSHDDSSSTGDDGDDGEY